MIEICAKTGVELDVCQPLLAEVASVRVSEFVRILSIRFVSIDVLINVGRDFTRYAKGLVDSESVVRGVQNGGQELGARLVQFTDVVRRFVRRRDATFGSVLFLVVIAVTRLIIIV